MAETPYNHYALYEPDASPDLTATGEYNSAIMGIDSDMHSERMEREQEYANLQIAIDNEADTRKAEDGKLTKGIATETAERKADTQASREERTRIEREYKAADVALDAKIQAEEMARVSADSGLATDIDDEKKARLNADNALADRITAETTRATAAEAALDTKFTNGLNSVTNGLVTVGNDVSKVESDYKAADAALIVRIDNAEAEISANSADLTGIKGLTYGEQHVHFVESDNGEYSSPALEEIAEQMGQHMTRVQITPKTTRVDTATLNKIASDWPNLALIVTDVPPDGIGVEFQFPFFKDGQDYVFAPIIGGYSEESGPYAVATVIKEEGLVSHMDMVNDPYWGNIQLKPFSTIGTGLKVVSDALTVDTSAIPTGITANTTWGELE